MQCDTWTSAKMTMPGNKEFIGDTVPTLFEALESLSETIDRDADEHS
jgi:hypothetical protein